MNIVTRTAAASLATIFVIAATAQAQAETLNYTVLRDGKPIGSHAVSIDTKGQMTQVSIDTDIEVKVLFVTAYKFKHKSKELWTNGQLMTLNSTTDDDGTNKKLTVRATKDTMTVDSIVKGQDRRQNADPATIPASLWNAETVKQNVLLNTLDGQVMKVDVKAMGAENVDAGGQSVTAQRYAISGELTRDVWFDDEGRLVRMRFPDKTNTEIVYALD